MSSIKKIVLHGFFWSITNQVSITIAGLVISGVLSRLITPAEFGIIAMVSLATGFLNVIKDFGFGAALVQKKTVSDDEYSTVFWFNLIIGVCLMIIVFLVSPYIGEFFKEKRVEQVTKVLSGTFVINAIGIIWSNKLVKVLAFKQIFYRSFLSLLCGGGIAIYLGFKGFGVWAIVSQIYTTLIVNTILNYFQIKWLPTFTLKKIYIRELIKFGLPLLADQSISYWARNIDNLLVGRVLGKDVLGYYNKGYNLMLLPVRQLTNTLTKVLFPSFSLIQDDREKIASIYLKISGVVAFIAFPLMMSLSMLAEPLILIVYGENWRPVIPIFKVLSILGMFQALAALSGNIYLALGKPKLMFQIGLFSRTITILGLVSGLYYSGLMGMIYGYCISSAIIFLPELFFIGKLLELSLKTIIFNFIPYLLIANVCYFSISAVFSKFDLPLVLAFLIPFSCFFLMYLMINFLIKSKAFSAILSLVRERRLVQG
ncbi:MOP flippase family protein [Pedobacter immunditicola]|uniref:MOP flippase family protein n=1 Tax=Pedobacter immunditicola TaxID=3133440 RepID=UPI0030A4C5B4